MSGANQIRHSKSEIFFLGLLIIAYVLIALAHATLAPLTTGPDELAHYEYVNFIATQGHLPLNAEERAAASYKSDQPPLYHLLAALPAALVDPTGPPTLKRVGDHPRRQLIERTRHAWGLYNTEDEQWPYRAEILRWHVGRWVAIFFGAVTILLTFFIARDVFAASRGPDRVLSSAPKTAISLRKPQGTGAASRVDRVQRGRIEGRGEGPSRVSISSASLSKGAETEAQKTQPPNLPLPHSPTPPISQPPNPSTSLPSASLRTGRTSPPTFQPSNLPSFHLSLLAAAVVAFIPRFALTGSMLNYETTLAFFAALFLWILLRISRSAEEQRPGEEGAQESGNGEARDASRITHYVSRFTFYVFLLGLVAGLAITTKLSALILPLEIVIGLWLIKRAQGWPWRRWGQAVLTAAGGTLLGVGWWFGFVLYNFNTIAEEGWWTGLLRPLIAADASDATTNRLLSWLTGGQAGFTGAIDNLDAGPPWEWAAIFFRTFWVVGIEEVQPLGWVGLAIAFLLCLIAAWGLIRHSLSLIHNSQFTIHNSLFLSLLLLHLILPLLLPLLRYAVTFSLADTAQGRHVLFLAAPAVGILLMWGWSVVSGQWPVVSKQTSVNSKQLPITNYQLLISNPLPFLPACFLFLWSLVQLWTMSWAYLPPLPVRTVAEARAQAVEETGWVINEAVTLVGYDEQVVAGGRLLRLDLIWEATGLSQVDYLTEVQLLDDQGEIASQWRGYPAGGRYPTRAWDSGDIVRDTVWLPLAGLSPAQYTLALNLVTNHIRQPRTVFAEPRPLTKLELSQPAPVASQPQIWQNGQPTISRPFQYRQPILVTLGELAPEESLAVRLQGPPLGDTRLLFEPVVRSAHSALFIVGPDWPVGAYQLQAAAGSRPPQGGEKTTIPPAGGPGGADLVAGEPEGLDFVAVGPPVPIIDRWQRQFSEPPMQQRVEANFADQVKLLGYDLGARRADPGGGLPVTLYWQGLEWMGDDYTIFVKLLATDQAVHGGRDRLPQEGYRTLYWAPGEIVVDPFGVPVDADAPDGIYTINIGLYKQVGEQAVSLPLVQDGQPLDVTSINIGPVKIGDTPPGLTIDTAQPQVELNQPFGQAPHLTLLGYDLTNDTGQPISRSPNLQSPISNLHLTLYWRAETQLPTDYTTFVHLRNEAGEVVAQKDQPPLAGAYPTSLWEPGEIIADEISLPLPPDLSSDDYRLFVGLYDLQTGQRLAVPGNPANEIELMTIGGKY